MQQALAASDLLEASGYRANVWSVTSFIELEREAQDCERWNRLHPNETPRQPYVKQLFDAEEGVFVAVTDYMKSLSNGIARWMPEFYEVLGTDGYGLSDSRKDLREFFEISSSHIAQAAISLLYRAGRIDRKLMQRQVAALGSDMGDTDDTGESCWRISPRTACFDAT